MDVAVVDDNPARVAEWEAGIKEQEAEEERLSDSFLAAARVGNQNALASWGPLVTDWALALKRAEDDPEPQRFQTFGEAMTETISYEGDGDGATTKQQLFQLLLDLANKPDLTIEQVRGRAQRLISRMASTYATNNTGLV